MPVRWVRWVAVSAPMLTVIAYETFRHAWLQPLEEAHWGNLLGGLLVGGVTAVISSHLLSRVERAQAELAAVKQREAMLAERQRFAAALHDDIAQVLFWTVGQLEEARWAAEHASSGQLAAHLERLQRTVDAARSRVRAMIHALHEETLGRSPVAFWQRVRALAQHTGLTIEGGSSGQVDDAPPPPHAVGDVMGLIQEAFWNIAKHAGTDRVRLRVGQDDASWTLEIIDGGRGFRPDRTTGGLGLALMHERAARAGGTLQIDSAPGRGTRLKLRLPRRPPEGETVACVS